MEKVLVTTINNDIMIFDSIEEYWDHQYKQMVEIFDNCFDTTISR